MSGVTILNTEIVPMVAEQNFWWVGIIVMVVVFLFTAADNEEYLLSFILSALIGIIVGIVISFFPTPAVPEYTKYEVALSDNISYVEFTERYEVIEQRGDIYVVKDKTENQNIVT